MGKGSRCGDIASVSNIYLGVRLTVRAKATNVSCDPAVSIDVAARLDREGCPSVERPIDGCRRRVVRLCALTADCARAEPALSRRGNHCGAQVGAGGDERVEDRGDVCVTLNSKIVGDRDLCICARRADGDEAAAVVGRDCLG